ncbi:hypothetical protein WR25_19736 [Diploscapter pachys]|uniref:Glutathione S-transferase n=1 Tax=Diploscapter pachys TaxID=2018661 RepID=A0A2A2KTM5_9BILA|nr:hypothetical protein WR25_19736 [Diploscapter pachys]
MVGKQKHRYTLYYANSRGRAEPIRLVLHYLGAEFDDKRMEMDDLRAVMEKKAPMKQVPFIEVDGGKLVLCQTTAICRYLAKSVQPELWLAGATKTLSAKCDMIVEGMYDIYNDVMRYNYEKDATVKEELSQRYWDKGRLRLEFLERILETSKGDYFLGKKLHWCDLFVLGNMGSMLDVDNRMFSATPHMRKWNILPCISYACFILDFICE